MARFANTVQVFNMEEGETPAGGVVTTTAALTSEIDSRLQKITAKGAGRRRSHSLHNRNEVVELENIKHALAAQAADVVESVKVGEQLLSTVIDKSDQLEKKEEEIRSKEKQIEELAVQRRQESGELAMSKERCTYLETLVMRLVAQLQEQNAIDVSASDFLGGEQSAAAAFSRLTAKAKSSSVTSPRWSEEGVLLEREAADLAQKIEEHRQMQERILSLETELIDTKLMSEAEHIKAEELQHALELAYESGQQDRELADLERDTLRNEIEFLKAEIQAGHMAKKAVEDELRVKVLDFERQKALQCQKEKEDKSRAQLAHSAQLKWEQDKQALVAHQDELLAEINAVNEKLEEETRRFKASEQHNRIKIQELEEDLLAQTQEIEKKSAQITETLRDVERMKAELAGSQQMRAVLQDERRRDEQSTREQIAELKLQLETANKQLSLAEFRIKEQDADVIKQEHKHEALLLELAAAEKQTRQTERLFEEKTLEWDLLLQKAGSDKGKICEALNDALAAHDATKQRLSDLQREMDVALATAEKQHMFQIQDLEQVINSLRAQLHSTHESLVLKQDEFDQLQARALKEKQQFQTQITESLKWQDVATDLQQQLDRVKKQQVEKEGLLEEKFAEELGRLQRQHEKANKQRDDAEQSLRQLHDQEINRLQQLIDQLKKKNEEKEVIFKAEMEMEMEQMRQKMKASRQHEEDIQEQLSQLEQRSAQEIQRLVKEYQEKSQALQERLDAERAENDRLQRALERTKEQLHEETSQLREKYHTETMKLQLTIEKVKRDAEEKERTTEEQQEATIAKLQQQIDQQRRNWESHEKQLLDEQAAKVQRLQHQNDQQRIQLDACERQMQTQAGANLERLQAKLDASRQREEDLQRQMDQLDKRNAQELQRVIKDHSDYAQQLEEQAERVRKQLKEVQQQLQREQQLVCEKLTVLSERDKAIATLETELANSRHQLATVQQSHLESQSEWQELMSKLQKEKSELQAELTDATRHQEEVRRLKQLLHDERGERMLAEKSTRAQFEERERSARVLSQEMELKLQSRLSTLEADIKEMQRRNGDTISKLERELLLERTAKQKLYTEMQEAHAQWQLKQEKIKAEIMEEEAAKTRQVVVHERRERTEAEQALRHEFDQRERALRMAANETESALKTQLSKVEGEIHGMSLRHADAASKAEREIAVERESKQNAEKEYHEQATQWAVRQQQLKTEIQLLQQRLDVAEKRARDVINIQSELDRERQDRAFRETQLERVAADERSRLEGMLMEERRAREDLKAKLADRSEVTELIRQLDAERQDKLELLCKLDLMEKKYREAIQETEKAQELSRENHVLEVSKLQQLLNTERQEREEREEALRKEKFQELARLRELASRDQQSLQQRMQLDSEKQAEKFLLELRTEREKREAAVERAVVEEQRRWKEKLRAVSLETRRQQNDELGESHREQLARLSQQLEKERVERAEKESLHNNTVRKLQEQLVAAIQQREQDRDKFTVEQEAYIRMRMEQISKLEKEVARQRSDRYEMEQLHTEREAKLQAQLINLVSQEEMERDRGGDQPNQVKHELHRQRAEEIDRLHKAIDLQREERATVDQQYRLLEQRLHDRLLGVLITPPPRDAEQMVQLMCQQQDEDCRRLEERVQGEIFKQNEEGRRHAMVTHTLNEGLVDLASTSLSARIIDTQPCVESDLRQTIENELRAGDADEMFFLEHEARLQTALKNATFQLDRQRENRLVSKLQQARAERVKRAQQHAEFEQRLLCELHRVNAELLRTVDCLSGLPPLGDELQQLCRQIDVEARVPSGDTNFGEQLADRADIRRLQSSFPAKERQLLKQLSHYVERSTTDPASPAIHKCLQRMRDLQQELVVAQATHREAQKRHCEWEMQLLRELRAEEDTNMLGPTEATKRTLAPLDPNRPLQEMDDGHRRSDVQTAIDALEAELIKIRAQRLAHSPQQWILPEQPKPTLDLRSAALRKYEEKLKHVQELEAKFVARTKATTELATQTAELLPTESARRCAIQQHERADWLSLVTHWQESARPSGYVPPRRLFASQAHQTRLFPCKEKTTDVATAAAVTATFLAEQTLCSGLL